MHLQGSDGQSIELRLVGYQFPHLATEAYDSNWLVIEGRVDHPRGSWAFQDACLLTYEVFGLAGWLDVVARGKQDRGEEDFTEPNLEFRLVGTGADTRLRVHFELEARPAWARSDVAGEEDLWVEFSLQDVDLIEAARSLREQLTRYPQRTEQ